MGSLHQSTLSWKDVTTMNGDLVVEMMNARELGGADLTQTIIPGSVLASHSVQHEGIESYLRYYVIQFNNFFIKREIKHHIESL